MALVIVQVILGQGSYFQSFFLAENTLVLL